MLALNLAKAENEKEKVTIKLLAVNEEKQKLIGMTALSFVVAESEASKKVQPFSKCIDPNASVCYSAVIESMTVGGADDMGEEHQPSVMKDSGGMA